MPLSISIAVGIRVGNMLGADEPDEAKKAALVAVIFACQLIDLFTKSIICFFP